jgi:voltage-gated potassium channel
MRPPEPNPRREAVWRIIFLSDTKAGRAFDLTLILLIVVSVVTLMLESVEELQSAHRGLFWTVEWVLTALFTVEYLARLWVVRRRWRYALSFYGLVDLVSILPSFLELLVPDSHYLMTFRVLRLLRMFRILKLAEYTGEANVLLNAMKSGRHKIAVFFTTVMTLVLIEGTIMYVIEHDENQGFRNIPQSIYWAIVTLTTVGYGDVAPVTVLGKMMASVIMLTGFAIIAVPTGIVTHEIGREMRGSGRGAFRRCRECGWEENDPRARFCQQCGVRLEE